MSAVKRGHGVAQLVEIMEALLAPGGCPWDREQSLESLRPFLIEECFELVDAIDRDDVVNHREELGDLLFQIVFQSALRKQEGHFDIDDVAQGIADKLRHRHPHVFGDATVSDADEVLGRWEEIKAAEKAAKGIDTSHLLDGVPTAMPALSRAHKISQKVSKVGFDWPTPEACLDKVREESKEIAEALREGAGKDKLTEEIGDLFFATASLARKLGIDSERAMAEANTKFAERFRKLENALAESGKTPKESDLEEMDAIWNRIKAG